MSEELRAEHAKRLLNDKLLMEAFDAMNDEFHRTWLHSSVHDIETREQAWVMIRLLERLKLHLTSYVETGEIAKKVKEFKI